MNFEYSDSGTESAYAQSSWYPTQFEAELECENNLQTEIFSIVSQLQSEGKTVVSEVQYPFHYNTDTSGPEVLWQCTGNADINWVVYKVEIRNLLKDAKHEIFFVDGLLTRIKREMNKVNPHVSLGDVVHEWRQVRGAARKWDLIGESSSVKILYKQKIDYPPSEFLDIKIPFVNNTEDHESGSYSLQIAKKQHFLNTNSVSNQLTKQISNMLNLSIQYKGGGGGVSSTRNVTRATTWGKVQSESKDESVTETFRLDFKVPPKTRKTYELSRYKFESRIPYNLKIVIAGAIYTNSGHKMYDISRLPLKNRTFEFTSHIEEAWSSRVEIKIDSEEIK